MGLIDALKILKVNLGVQYKRGKYDFNHNSNISEGQLKQISDREFVGLSKGKPIYCTKDKKGKMKCKVIPIKLLKRRSN
ncbi:MAG: hypothetical protein AABX28_02625 [Nanoarchaeota archaeon]